MIVGVPKEIKADEYRVAMLPVGVEELTQLGQTVLIESGAGLGSGLTDAQYEAAGAALVSGAAEIWARADLIVKVKEPQPSEWPVLRSGQVVFTYFHFAATGADPRLIARGITANRVRDPARRAGRPAAVDPDERGRRADEYPGGGQVSRTAPGRARDLCSRASPASRPPRWLYSAAGSSGPTPPRWPPAWGRTSGSSTSTSTGFDTSTTSCPHVTTLYSDRHTISRASSGLTW